MVSLLRAHRWPSTVVALAGLAFIGFVSRSSSVSVPLIQEMLPVRALVGLFAVATALMPLYATFPDLTRTLAREPRARLWRAVVAVGLVAAAFGPAMSGELSGPTWAVADLRMTLVLTALGLFAVVVIGDLAWLAVLASGFVCLIVGAAPGSPLTAALLRIPTAALVVAVVVGVLTYAVLGPRLPGADDER